MREAPMRKVFVRSGLPLLAGWSLITLTLLLPPVDAARAPYVDLTGTFSQCMYWLTQSCGKLGAPVVSALMLSILVSRRGITFHHRLKEAGVITMSAAIFAGGGATLNENMFKEHLRIPRPNIVWLAGENGAGPLGMTPEEFYRNRNREARGMRLDRVLNSVPEPIPLSAGIKAHWIDETGYSFPSGHAFSSMFIATFFLLTGSTCLTTKRILVFYALLSWAVAACCSRILLGVHTPADISAGSLLGLAVGLPAWLAARTLLARYG